jgi:hypothetical protein
MIPASYYQSLHLIALTLVSLLYAVQMQKHSRNFLQTNTNNAGVLIYIILFVIIVGLRPISGYYFGDTANYALSYYLYANHILDVPTGGKEWLFNHLMYSCAQIMDVQSFFLIVEVLYVIPVLIACRRWVPKHALLMFIFCMGAFSFFSYSVNGIRNGMACSLIIAAMAYLTGSKKDKLVAFLLCILAFNCHRSVALPILCMLVALYIKDIRYILLFWLGSIVISLVAGGTIENFFTGLGFDDRMSGYALSHDDDSMFSSSGFRFDFLLYSAMPIVLGYYVIIKKRICDRPYHILLTTYILCNAFWVMMIRASYSNRFAYLSWFLYALVLAYPCLKLPIWKDQGRKASYILLAHLGFTLFMDLIYYHH